MLIKPHIKERLSMAYVDAIAGRAGVNLTRSLHDYGVDGTFHPIKKTSYGYTSAGFTVEFQTKATTNWQVVGTDVVYDLSAKAYNDMVGRDPCETPLVIIVMCLPPLDAQWLRQSEKAALMKRSCYWYWEPHGALTQNRSTVRIAIPRANFLDVAGLQKLLQGAEAYQRGKQNHV